MVIVLGLEEGVLLLFNNELFNNVVLLLMRMVAVMASITVLEMLSSRFVVD